MNKQTGGYVRIVTLIRESLPTEIHQLNGEILTLFTTPQTETAASESYAYGFESFVFNGKKVYGHSGAPGINSNTLTFADGSYTVVILLNYDPGFAQKFARDVACLQSLALACQVSYCQNNISN